VCSCAVFFFQAEHGLRDRNVTGVQTCALPILVLINSFDILELFRTYTILLHKALALFVKLEMKNCPNAKFSGFGFFLLLHKLLRESCISPCKNRRYNSQYALQ